MHAVGGSKRDERNTRGDQSYITLKEMHDSLCQNDVEIFFRISNIHLGNEERNRRKYARQAKISLLHGTQTHTVENKVLCF